MVKTRSPHRLRGPQVPGTPIGAGGPNVFPGIPIPPGDPNDNFMQS